MKKILSWLWINALFVTCAVYGVLLYNKYAANLLVFSVWATAIMHTVASHNEEVKKLARERGRPVPAWLSVTVDLIVVGIMASHNWFFTAAGHLWTVCCEQAIYQKDTLCKSDVRN